MKPRQIIILALILVVSIFLVFLKSQHKEALISTEADSRLDLKLVPSDIRKISLKKSDGNEVVIQKENGEWVLPGLWNASVDQVKLNRLLNTFAGLKGELRANDASVLKDFEISDENSFHFIFSNDKSVLADLAVSFKMTPAGDSFARLQGTNAVYLISENLFGSAGLYGDLKTKEIKPDFWLDLRFAYLGFSDLQSITLKKIDGGKEETLFDLERQKTEEKSERENWVLKGTNFPFHAGMENIYRYVGQIQEERAKTVLDPKGDYGLDNPDLVLSVESQDGKKKTIQIKQAADKKSNVWYAKVAEAATVFEILESNVKSLQVTPTFFLTTIPFSDLVGSARSLKLKTAMGEVRLAKEKGSDGKESWKTAGEGAAIPEEKISEYMRSLQNVSIEKYLPELAEKDFPKDLGQVLLEIELEAGETVLLEISTQADQEAAHVAVRKGFIPAFQISQSAFDQITSLQKS